MFFKYPVITFGILLFAAGAALAGEAVIVNVSTPACPYADSRLSEKLGLHLSAVNTVPIIWNDDKPDSLAASDESAGFDQLLARGKILNGRFLVDILVNRMDIIKRKITVIPLLLHRYQTYAVLSGTLRIIDIAKSRLVKLEPINYDLKASDQWQVADDDSNDPALLVPSDEKITLFDRLDEKAAAGLFAEINRLIKGNHFGSHN